MSQTLAFRHPDRIAIDNIFPTKSGHCAINNTAARDWAQSNMEWNHPDHALELAIAAAKYHDAVGEVSGALEVGGGTIPRFQLDKAGMNPYEHIRNVRKAVGKDVPLMMLVRSNAGGSMNDLPVDVLKDYVRKSVEAGIDVVRNFHSHNDPRQFKHVYDATREAGGHFQAAYSWARSDRDPTIFNPKNVVNFFKELEKEGVHPDSYVLKDPSGVLNPLMARIITKEMKKEFPDKPFGIHTHNQARFGEMSCIAAAEAGANFVDVGPSAGGFAAQPSATSVLSAMESHGITTGLKEKSRQQRDAALAALEDVDNRAQRIAHIYQTAPYIAKAAKKVQSIEATKDVKGNNEEYLQNAYMHAVKDVLEEYNNNVIGLTHRTSIAVLKHGVAGGQSTGLNNTLILNEAIQKRDEVLKALPGLREDIGDTCQVTPVADRVLREAIRIVVFKKDPNKRFHPHYAMELTGEAGPVQGVINPVKQRRALRERTEALLETMVDVNTARSFSAEGGVVDRLLDNMQAIYAPTRDAERLKLITTRAEELASIYKDSATDKDYAAYVSVLNEEIARSGMKDEHGKAMTTINDVHAKLEAEAESLRASLQAANAVSPADYEALQRGKVSDVVFNRAMKGNAAFASTGLSRDQVVKLMQAATVTTVVGADLLAPDLENAKLKAAAFFKEHKLPVPVSSQQRAEDASLMAMFGDGGMGMSIAGTHFLYRNAKDTPWKHPEAVASAIPARNPRYSPSALIRFSNRQKPNEEVIREAIARVLDKDTSGHSSYPASRATVKVIEYGNDHYQVIFQPADFNLSPYRGAINEALKAHGAEIDPLGRRTAVEDAKRAAGANWQMRG